MKSVSAPQQSAPPPPPPAAYGAASMVDLEDQIDWMQSSCLNLSARSSLAHILKKGHRDQEVKRLSATT
eukprot:2701190-Pleurochrysis_carterae.AAC.2